MTTEIGFYKKLAAMLHDSEAWGIQGGLLTIAAIASVGVYYGHGLLLGFCLVLVLGTVALSAYLFRLSFATAAKNLNANRHRQVQSWVLQGKTDDERKSRKQVADTHGVDYALAKATQQGFSPAFNINGALMLDSGLDIHGNLYGVVGAADAMMDSTSVPDSFQGYVPPSGMD